MSNAAAAAANDDGDDDEGDSDAAADGDSRKKEKREFTLGIDTWIVPGQVLTEKFHRGLEAGYQLRIIIVVVIKRLVE